MPSYQKSEGKVTVSFSGTLDTATSIGFEDDLYAQIKESAGRVIFDLKEVTTISSMFLRVCTKAAQKTGKENFSIVNVPEAAMKVFKLTRLDSFLNIKELIASV